MGVDYFDRVTLTGLEESEDGVTITGEQVSIRARFLVDASGPRGFVHRTLGLAEEAFANYPPTQSLYSHFSGVDRFDEQPAAPYPPDDAALHHVFDGGWIWMLRFNNGLTSAGVAATDSLASQLRFDDRDAAWNRLMDLLPAVRGQFARAKPELPFVHARRLSFLSSSVAGRRWAMLPSAAGFIDPLLSTGFALTLFGVARLGEILEKGWDGDGIAAYAAQTRRELLATARLIGALYATMNNFPLFTSLTFLYFAAASFSEAARRLDKRDLASSFLLCDDPVFGPASARCCAQAHQVRTPEDTARLSAEILRTIEPFNVAGLGDASRRNWFPVSQEDLIQASSKLGASPNEVKRLLNRSGFAPTSE
jgi:FADH2 O2-dependent halogenase